jgi:hypothetical protein
LIVVFLYPEDKDGMSTETLVTTYKTTLCHSPEEHNVNSHRGEYLESHPNIQR